MYMNCPQKLKFTFLQRAFAKWDADFYIKVDDDVHVNLGMVVSVLARHRSKPHVYIGCMKSGLVLSQKGVKYHEPGFWKFGEEGNKYFRHASGQIYAISKDLASYISVNKRVLHRYTNEDVSLGSWLIGLDVDILMIEISAVGPLWIANGRRKQETLVLHHLTGAVVAFVNQLKEWQRCTNGVEKVMELYGLLVSETGLFLLGD